MLKSFVEKICDLSICTAEKGGRLLTSKPLNPVRDAEPEPLKVHTLHGITDYDMDRESSTFVVHVEDYANVHLVSPLYGKEKQRDRYVTATAYPVTQRFGEYMPLESFITYLQSCFVQDETTAKILRVVGNIVQGSEAEYVDDGVTQRVTARAGITRRENVDVPNPVTLRPFRTFPDIEQPESLFVLRIMEGKDGEKPKYALFEADGGAWKNKAVASIKKFFLDADDMHVIG